MTSEEKQALDELLADIDGLAQAYQNRVNQMIDDALQALTEDCRRLGYIGTHQYLELNPDFYSNRD